MFVAQRALFAYRRTNLLYNFKVLVVRRNVFVQGTVYHYFFRALKVYVIYLVWPNGKVFECLSVQLSRRRFTTEREESQSHEHLQEGTDALKQKLMKRCHAEELVERQLESVFRLRLT